MPLVKKSYERILLARSEVLGDLIVATASIRAVRRRYPDALIGFVVSKNLELLVKNHPLLNACFLVHTHDVSGVDVLSKVFAEHNFDVSIHFGHDALVAQAACKAKIPLRVGFSDFKEIKPYLNKIVHRRKKKGFKHEMDFNNDLLKVIDVVPTDEEKFPSLAPFADGVSLFAEDYSVFHLTASGNKALVPLEIFSLIARWLIKNKNHKIVIIGSDDDAQGRADALLESLSDAERGHIINLIKQTSLIELGGLLKNARITIARDSGPAHLAAALDCPTLTFMSSARAFVSGVRWRPLGKHTKVFNASRKARLGERTNLAMQRGFDIIDPKAVLPYVEELLAVK